MRKCSVVSEVAAMARCLRTENIFGRSNMEVTDDFTESTFSRIIAYNPN